MSLQSTLGNPLYKMSFCKSLEDADVIRLLISKTKGLQQDIIAMGLLRSPTLLISFASSDKLEQVLSDHPCLANAIQYVISIVTRGGTLRHPSLQGSARREADEIQQELMQMDPRLVAHAEMLAAQEEALRMRQSSQGVTSSPGSSGSSSQNTGMGHGSISNPPLTSAAPGPSTGQVSQQQIITSGLFRQAMAMAMSNTQQTAQTPRYENAIQQIRLMGIQARDDVIRQALMVSDGNVEAAVNLLFESEL